MLFGEQMLIVIRLSYLPYRETVLIQEELRKTGHDIPPIDLEFDEVEIGSGMFCRIETEFIYISSSHSLTILYYTVLPYPTPQTIGASGVVRKGLWLKSTEVAVKALKNVPEFTDIQEMTNFYKEIETLR